MLQNLFDKVHRAVSGVGNDCIARRTRSQVSNVNLQPVHPFVSASDLQNFCFDDHFSDFLDLYVPAPNPHPLQPLFDLGVQFENKIITKLREQTGLELPKLSCLQTSRNYVNESDSRADFAKTVECMQRGDPILYSAYLWNPDRKVHGIPDLLVRNDCLHLLSLNCADRPARQSNLGNYFYIPVEIKFSTLHRVGHHFLSSSGRQRYYKTQLMMYSRLLAEIQGVFPCVAYIIGKRVMDSGGQESAGELTHLGFVDYTTKDSPFSDILDAAVDWMKRVKNEGRTWQFGNFPRELYPNMKMVHPYHQALKTEWAEHLKDITQIWRCTTTHRENARRYKIYSWDDPRCTSETLGISPGYAETVDNLLTVNRSEHVLFLPEHLPKVVCPYGPAEEVMYVDFETLMDEFGEEGKEKIFMIGVWYQNRYYYWLMMSNTAVEECRVMLEFHQFWVSCGQPKCMYWYAEKGFWQRAIARQPDLTDLPPVDWLDLHEPWVSQRIVVKGALNFKLKSLIRALRQIGFTEVELPPEQCDDGLQAMRQATAIYASGEVKEKSFEHILHYNQLDCQYVQELYQFVIYLRGD